MNKVIRDGNVAVLYSPGYGAGWSTWGDPESVFDPDTVNWVEHGKIGDCPYKSKDYHCMLGADDLVIEWLPVGTIFEIIEYDGYESIRLIGNNNDFLVA